MSWTQLCGQFVDACQLLRYASCRVLNHWPNSRAWAARCPFLTFRIAIESGEQPICLPEYTEPPEARLISISMRMLARYHGVEFAGSNSRRGLSAPMSQVPTISQSCRIRLPVPRVTSKAINQIHARHPQFWL